MTEEVVNNIINTEYVQRSKIFIYPFLYIPSSCLVSPENTYISWIKDGEVFIDKEDAKLICVYNNIIGENERRDEKKYLLLNQKFLGVYSLENKKTAYVFKIERADIEKEWKTFLNGKYSLLSTVGKYTIVKHYAEEPMKSYIDVYFNPNKYYNDYSEILDIPVHILSDRVELLSKPDIIKETLIT